jgi:hypothetical protein
MKMRKNNMHSCQSITTIFSVMSPHLTPLFFYMIWKVETFLLVRGLWYVNLSVLTIDSFANLHILIDACRCLLIIFYCNLVSRSHAGSLGYDRDW